MFEVYNDVTNPIQSMCIIIAKLIITFPNRVHCIIQIGYVVLCAVYLLLSMTREHEERNHGLETTHLAIPLLRSNSVYSMIVSSSYFHCIPVVIPGVQHQEE